MGVLERAFVKTLIIMGPDMLGMVGKMFFQRVCYVILFTESAHESMNNFEKKEKKMEVYETAVGVIRQAQWVILVLSPSKYNWSIVSCIIDMCVCVCMFEKDPINIAGTSLYPYSKSFKNCSNLYIEV